MRGKKIIFLAVFVVVMVVGLAASGTALASPAKALTHHSVCASGILVPIGQTPGTTTVDPATGEVVVIGAVTTWALHGDLEGTYCETIDQHGSLITGLYTFRGRATFVGTLDGKKIRWAGPVRGNGFLDPASGGTAGWEKCTVVITRSAGCLPHLRGFLKASGSWSAEGGSATYKALLVW